VTVVELVDKDRVKIFKNNTRDCRILIKRGGGKRRKRPMTTGDFLNYMPIYKKKLFNKIFSKKQSNSANMNDVRIIHKKNELRLYKYGTLGQLHLSRNLLK